MFGIPKEILQKIKREFPSRCKVQLVSMNDPYTRIDPGTHGTVIDVDDIGTIHVLWDSGSTLGVVYGEDSCRKIGGNTTDVRAVYQRQRR